MVQAWCVIFTLLVATGIGVSEADDGDLGGLVAFMAGANGGGLLQTVWSRSDYCNWDGVRECLKGRVTKLVLENLWLNGTFAGNTLSRLDQLRVLSLKGNALTGPIPDLSSLRNLKSLFLNYNNFTGSFPASIATLHRLKVIVLSHNSLAGQIPLALALLPRLHVLSVENNRLSGSLPAFNQSSLIFLNVSDNLLSGLVPETGVLSEFNLSSFSGNPGLCGRLVDRPCPVLTPDSSPTSSPQNQFFWPVNSKVRKLSKRAKIAVIVVGSVVGFLAILCLVVLFVYRGRRHRSSDEHTTGKQTRGGKTEGEIAGESDAQQSSKSKSTSKSGRSPSPRDNHSGNVSGNLVFCGGETQIYSLEDLLKATAVILGRGCLGSTYKVVMDSRLTVAVKRVKKCNTMSRSEQEKHMYMLGNLRHPNLVSLRAYFRAKDESLLVYDYYPNGNLFSLIHGTASVEGKAKPLHWTSCLKIAEDMGQGLAYLHSLGVIHGDLKSTNVLIGSDFEACITDYGLTVLGLGCDSDADTSDSVAADSFLAYRAPECRCPLKMTYSADVYSFGVILLEILSGKTPSQALMGMPDLPNWVVSVREGDESGSASEGSEDKLRVLLNIAMACVSPSPELRPSMRDGVRMITEARESSQSSASASDHSPARWSDTIHSLPRERGADPTFTERD
ncbi:hypothetical protein SUGI_0276320 [Cryptomeria japonica]|uniref:inactive leucine-rich repeat receptor-like serine/threonine-protein kinase At1g60630 n=1 Tax=Cryptomeria japonica TaxID=3369 RepID=UPI00240892E7|nr:inactive leucine-rich repeat receptor-like serine/threonine-protein kinase At1g60630 [Cryptomeria japonica]GLJ16336.1 hypothetical protein SUGI_0276320 [Cryptomeria japonica]